MTLILVYHSWAGLITDIAAGPFKKRGEPDMSIASSSDTETIRIKYAFWLAVVGLLLAVALAMFLVFKAEMKDTKSADVVAIVGLFTSVLGTLVGAFFGVQVGAAGADQERRSRRDAEQDRRHAETMAQLAMGRLPPDDAERVLEMMHRVS